MICQTLHREKSMKNQTMVDTYHVDKIDPSNLQYRYIRHFYNFHGYYSLLLSYNHLQINMYHVVENMSNIFVPKILHIFNNLR